MTQEAWWQGLDPMVTVTLLRIVPVTLAQMVGVSVLYALIPSLTRIDRPQKIGRTMTPIPLSSRILATYYPLWWNTKITGAAPTTYNQIYLFNATPNGSTGAFSLDYSVAAADIATCRNRGQRIVLSCGGANTGFNFQNRTQSMNFVNSVKAIITKLGGNIDGCDLNTFEAGIKPSTTEMIWIAQQLKAAYGASFSITCPPAPGAGYAPNDRVLTAAMAQVGVLDYAGPQFYDSSDLTTEAILEQLIPQWVTNLGNDASKVVLGVGSNYSGGGTTAVTVAAWKKLVATYPNLRGIFGWSAEHDFAKSWSFANTVSPLVLGSTPPPPPPHRQVQDLV